MYGYKVCGTPHSLTRQPGLPGIAGLLSAALHAALAAAVYAFVPNPKSPRPMAISVEIRPKIVPPALPAAEPRSALASAAAVVRPKPAPERPARQKAAFLPKVVPAMISTPTAIPSAQSPVATKNAPASAAQPPAGSATAPVTGAGTRADRGFDFSGALAGYLGRVTSAVASRRRYPALALELQLEGDAVVSVRVNRDGTLAGKPSLAQSCGHDLLDIEALRMVMQAAPFPPLPDGYPALTAELRLPVRFRLES